ncbi:thiamine ABC transporter substrate binding subunit [Psychromonas sp.]|uniref:thiamine ABC transporter substrate binding subunit n=1 Tax=Psychromonas sp. TaxID=1884585 RepID=UPI0039E33778
MKKIIPLIAFSILLSMPATADKLVVYTYDSFSSDWGPGPKIKQAFEAKCACDLEFVALADGVSILNRLRLEGKNSKADLLLGLDNNLMAEAKKTGLLSEHSVDLENVTLPGGWSDKLFVPFDYGYFSFVYNTEILKNPPKSLKELVEKRDDLKIIYQDPRTSTPGQGLMLWMKWVYGDQALSAWKKLAKKTVTVTKGWSESYNMFLQGEADMVLSYTTSPAYHLIAEGKNQYAAADFSEGHYMQIEVAAKVKSSRNQKLADQFMAFIVSDEFQSVIPTGNWMYPVTKTSLPKEFEQLTLPSKSFSFDAEKVENNRKEWVREWQNALIN